MGLFRLCYVLDIDGYDGTIGMVITVLKWTWNWDRSSGDGGLSRYGGMRG